MEIDYQIVYEIFLGSIKLWENKCFAYFTDTFKRVKIS